MPISQKTKESCLRQFATKYPDSNQVVVIDRSDNKIRVFDRMNNNILFDQKGRATIELDDHPMMNITPIVATFETIK
jgi:hypothetical protein